MDETNWNITNVFPRFGELQVEEYRAMSSESEKKLISEMFEVEDIINPKDTTDFFISTSIYCKPHNPGTPPIEPITLSRLKSPHASVRDGGSWWNTYLQPLIRNLDRIQHPWNLRIHIASELRFLIPYLSHPRVEFWVMKHSSVNTIPGMLWRYLPLECGNNFVARGTDSLLPGRKYLSLAAQAFNGPCRFFRQIRPRDKDGTGSLVYRSMPGPLIAREGKPLPFIDHSKAWVWFQMKGLWPRTAFIPWYGEETPKFGMDHWARYGQDEQFLSHWLYYIACEEGLYSVVNNAYQSRVFDYDKQFAETMNSSFHFL